MSAAPTDALLFRRYSTAGLAHGAVERLAGAGRMAFRPDENQSQPFIVEPVRQQLKEAAHMLALFVLAAPGLFIAADWLRYSA